jgi:hypothetical protein
MKKIYPFILLFITLVACTSSDKQDQANLSESELRKIFMKDMNEYLKLINSGDFDKAFDFIPAKVFEMAPKEQLIGMYEQLEAGGMRMEMDLFKITDISEVATKDNTNYCRFRYKGKITLHVTGEMLEMKDLLATQFETQYEGSVSTVLEDRIELDLTQTMFAMSVEGSTDWKYVEYNNSSKAMMDKVVPSDIISQLK